MRQDRKHLAVLVYSALLLHVILAILGTFIGAFFIQHTFTMFSSFHSVAFLFVVSLFSAVFSAEPDYAPNGFINADNCIWFFLLSIGIIVFIIISFIFLIRKKRWAAWSIGGIYLADLCFVLVHYIWLNDMMDIQGQKSYVVLSVLFKLLGIALIAAYLTISRRKIEQI